MSRIPDFPIPDEVVVPRKLFVVTQPMFLNETRSPMRPGQTGFACSVPTDPVQIELDNIGYTVSLSVFENSTKWFTPAW